MESDGSVESAPLKFSIKKERISINMKKYPLFLRWFTYRIINPILLKYRGYIIIYPQDKRRYGEIIQNK